MKRKEFLKALKEELRKRRDIEAEEVLFYYDELIQDAIDNGESEDVFIMNLGSVRDIVRRLEDDESFIVEVKDRNTTIVKNAVSTTVKIIGYFIIAVLGFVMVVTSLSLFASGIAVVFAGIVKIVVTGSVDTYGYIAILGLVMVGIGLAIFGVAIVRWFVQSFKPALLSIFRNTKDFLNRKGK